MVSRSRLAPDIDGWSYGYDLKEEYYSYSELFFIFCILWVFAFTVVLSAGGYSYGRLQQMIHLYEKAN